MIPNHNRRDDFYCGCQNHFQIYSSQQKFLKLNADKSEQICNYAHNKKEEKVLLISGVITLEDLIDTSNVDFRSEKKSLFQTQNCKVMWALECRSCGSLVRWAFECWSLVVRWVSFWMLKLGKLGELWNIQVRWDRWSELWKIEVRWVRLGELG